MIGNKYPCYVMNKTASIVEMMDSVKLQCCSGHFDMATMAWGNIKTTEQEFTTSNGYVFTRIHEYNVCDFCEYNRMQQSAYNYISRFSNGYSPTFIKG